MIFNRNFFISLKLQLEPSLELTMQMSNSTNVISLFHTFMSAMLKCVSYWIYFKIVV